MGSTLEAATRLKRIALKLDVIMLPVPNHDLRPEGLSLGQSFVSSASQCALRLWLVTPYRGLSQEACLTG